MYPVLFSLGKINIYSYGVLLSLAFLTAMILAVKKGKYEHIDENRIIDLSLIIILSAVIGARILYIILEWPLFKNNYIRMIRLDDGGLVFYGGLIGSSAAFIVFCKLKKILIFRYADIFAPSLAIGQAIGRIGCFFSGCCYGKKTCSWIGVHFPTAHDSAAHIPTQLIESTACILLFIFLHRLYYRKKFHGHIFSFYLMGYSTLRFCIEFFRGDDRGGFFFHYFSISQLIGIIGVLAGTALFFINRRSKI